MTQIKLSTHVITNDNNGDDMCGIIIGDDMCGDINYKVNLSQYYSDELISWYDQNNMLPVTQQTIGTTCAYLECDWV